MKTLGNYTMIKITSHLEDKRQLANFIINEEADHLAGDATTYNLDNPDLVTPELTSWDHSCLTADDKDCWKEIEGWNHMKPPEPNDPIIPNNICDSMNNT
eukprot:141897_1